MPDIVERRSKDSFGSLDRELKPPGPKRRNREGIRLEIGSVKKLRGVRRDTMPIMNPLELRDKVWGDSCSTQSDAKLREECHGRCIAQGGRGMGFRAPC